MGPKRTDNTSKGAKLSQGGIGGLNTIGGTSIGEQGYYRLIFFSFVRHVNLQYFLL